MNEHLQAITHMREAVMRMTSHEFQAPLSRIKLSLGLLRDSKIGAMSPKQLRLLQIAVKSNQQLIYMINTLLTAARLQSEQWPLRFQNLDLVHMVKELLKEYRDVIKSRHQQLVVNIPNHTVHARIDPDLIRVAFKNLLDNASKYTHEGGAITVNLSVEPEKVLLSVQDTGIGIPEKDLPQLFSQFYRGDTAILTHAQGFGIGLYSSREIVRRHKGDIEVTSTEGKGSTFTIHLPKTILLSH